jgi:hypothetical protein
MLGYHLPKNGANKAVYGDEHHAWNRILGESFFIMGDAGGKSNSPYAQRRVNPAEYSRINGGWERRQRDGVGGMYMPTNATIMVANPENPILNIQKK